MAAFSRSRPSISHLGAPRGLGFLAVSATEADTSPSTTAAVSCSSMSPPLPPATRRAIVVHETSPVQLSSAFNLWHVGGHAYPGCLYEPTNGTVHHRVTASTGLRAAPRPDGRRPAPTGSDTAGAARRWRS